VDAYDGTVTLYEWDEEDPILQTWEKVFPGTVQPKDEIPAELMEHLRYPEDMFKVQRYQFARYHVTDETDWYNGNNRWEVPTDPNSTGNLQPPYRLFVEQGAGTDTGATDEAFSLTSTFVPYNKNNLAAFVSVDSDATSPDYGKMRVLELDDQSAKGPGQIANDFNSDEDVANQLAQFNRSGGQAIPGNLLTLPVADGFIYVEPIYAVRAGSTVSYPSLAYVLVSYNGEVGIGDSLPQALGDALGAAPTVVPPDDNSGGPDEPGTGEEPGAGEDLPVPVQIRNLLDDAQALFDKADEAQRAGNSVKWARLMEAGKDKIDAAVRIADAQQANQPETSEE
jgi:uncharacterized membrane protein (UPF0182 family)